MAFIYQRLPDQSILPCTLNISEYEQISKKIIDKCDREDHSTGIKYQATREYNISAIQGEQSLFIRELCARWLENVN